MSFALWHDTIISVVVYISHLVRLRQLHHQRGQLLVPHRPTELPRLRWRYAHAHCCGVWVWYEFGSIRLTGVVIIGTRGTRASVSATAHRLLHQQTAHKSNPTYTTAKHTDSLTVAQPHLRHAQHGLLSLCSRGREVGAAAATTAAAGEATPKDDDTNRYRSVAAGVASVTVPACCWFG